MEALVKAIRETGIGIGNDIVKVDMFLNHRVDTALMEKVGSAFADAFRDQQPTLVMTVEASGIPCAYATAAALGHIPMIYAKKSPTRNCSNDVYEADVFSFTHNVMNSVRVSKDYLPAGSRVLLIDDFLANGEAGLGLYALCEQAGAQAVGFGACVEKSMQPGRSRLEAKGLRVVSLAKVTEIRDGNITVTD